VKVLDAEEIVKLLGPWETTRAPESGKQEAIIVSVRLSDDDFGNEAEDGSLAELEAQIERSLEASDAGEWDGHETGGGYHKIFLYGRCANRMAESILPVALRYPALPGSYMVKRFGEIGSDEQHIWLSSDQRA
jgi:hypothetical protein